MPKGTVETELLKRIIKNYDEKKGFFSPDSKAIADLKKLQRLLESQDVSMTQQQNELRKPNAIFNTQMDITCFLTRDGSKTTFAAIFVTLFDCLPTIDCYKAFCEKLPKNKKTVSLIELISIITDADLSKLLNPTSRTAQFFSCRTEQEAFAWFKKIVNYKKQTGDVITIFEGFLSYKHSDTESLLSRLNNIISRAQVCGIFKVLALLDEKPLLFLKDIRDCRIYQLAEREARAGDLNQIADILTLLSSLSIQWENNFLELLRNSSEIAFNLLKLMAEKKFLTQDNCFFFFELSESQIKELYAFLNELKKTGLLNDSTEALHFFNIYIKAKKELSSELFSDMLRWLPVLSSMYLSCPDDFDDFADVQESFEKIKNFGYVQIFRFVFSLLGDKGLLTKVNFEKIIKAPQMLPSIKSTLETMNTLNLLKTDDVEYSAADKADKNPNDPVEEQEKKQKKCEEISRKCAQENFDAVIKSKNQQIVARSLDLALKFGLFSNGEGRNQIFFETIVRKCEDIEISGYFTPLKRLFQSLSDYSAAYFLTCDSFLETLHFTEIKAESVRNGINMLVKCSMNLLTQENYRLLLETVSDEVLKADSYCLTLLNFTDILAGNADEAKFKRALATLPFLKTCVSPENGITENHYRLYRHFSKEPHFLSLSILKSIIQLSDDEATALMRRLQEPTSVVLRLDCNHDLLADFLAERDNLVKLHLAIPIEIRNHNAIPVVIDPESSIQDEKIETARARINALKKELNITNEITYKQLEEIETDIREYLLLKIKAELEHDKNKPGINAQTKSLLNQKIQFIEKNLSALANQTASADIIQQAVAYFSDTDSVAQTAWRAYEPTAEVTGWPNLLTAPASVDNQAIWSNHASSSVTVTLKSGSDIIRRNAAICFLASKNYSDMREDFVFTIAEIRRAHNKKGGIDNPSYFPGSLSRFLIATNKHPLFKSEEKPSKDFKEVVENTVRNVAQIVLDQMSETCVSDYDARLLLCAIFLLSKKNKISIFNDKNVVENMLFSTQEDLESIAPGQADNMQIKAWITAAKNVANQFLDRLVGDDGAALYNAVAEHTGIGRDHRELNYLIAKNVESLAEKLSLPEKLMRKYSAKSSETIEEDKEGIEVRFYKLLPESEKINLAESLQNLFQRLSHPSAFKNIPSLTHESIEQMIQRKLPQDSNISVNDVTAVLRTLFGEDYPKSGSSPGEAQSALFCASESKQTTFVVKYERFPSPNSKI